jgi:Transposase IS66 family
VLVRLVGQAPITGTVYELEKLRCNLCLEVFTAEAPAGVGEEKYDATSASMMAARRAADLAPPIQMCDALSRNLPKTLEVIQGNCLAHGRRRLFVKVAQNFPEQCRFVLETLAEIYHNDELTRDQGMSPEQRLGFHQTRSAPVMEELQVWLTAQLQEKKTEPNSGLGQAISYLLNHWQELTLFLRQPRAPLDNSICERALKKVILHRKNALFYKSQNGAQVGDLFMSLIHTCELSHANPFDYLTQLQRHAADLAEVPAIGCHGTIALRWRSWISLRDREPPTRKSSCHRLRRSPANQPVVQNAEAWTWSERSPLIPSYSPARCKVNRSTLAVLLSTNA